MERRASSDAKEAVCFGDVFSFCGCIPYDIHGSDQPIELVNTESLEVKNIIQIAAASKCPKDLERLMTSGLEFQAKQQTSEAIQCFETAIKLGNGDKNIVSEALCCIGIVHHELGATREAEQFYKKAIDCNNDHYKSIYNLGSLYSDLDEDDKSIQYFLRASVLQPSDVDVWCNLGNAYRNRKLVDKAIKCYKKSIEIDRNELMGYYNLAVVYQDIDRIDHAIRNYEKVLEIDPHHCNTLMNLGLAYQQIAQIDNGSPNCCHDGSSTKDLFLRQLYKSASYFSRISNDAAQSCEAKELLEVVLKQIHSREKAQKIERS